MKNTKKIILILALIAKPNLSFAQNTRTLRVSKTDSISVNSPVNIVFNHTSSRFDSEGATIESVGKILNAVKESGLNAILTTAPLASNETEFNGMNFVVADDVNLEVITEGGAHNLWFPYAKKFIFTGGYFKLCLCEATRDALARSTPALYGESIEAYFPTDAVFDNFYAWAPYMVSEYPTFGDLSKFVKNDYPLNAYLPLVSDKRLLQAVEDTFIGKEKKLTCNDQNNGSMEKYPDKTHLEVELTVYRSAKKIGVINHETSLKKQNINLRFVSSDELLKDKSIFNP